MMITDIWKEESWIFVCSKLHLWCAYYNGKDVRAFSIDFEYCALSIYNVNPFLIYR
jgi:hypothetical protein